MYWLSKNWITYFLKTFIFSKFKTSWNGPIILAFKTRSKEKQLDFERSSGKSVRGLRCTFRLWHAWHSSHLLSHKHTQTAHICLHVPTKPICQCPGHNTSANLWHLLLLYVSQDYRNSENWTVVIKFQTFEGVCCTLSQCHIKHWVCSNLEIRKTNHLAL